ncbi:MAG: ATP-dependent metallopeptidase FtsH/Yme1/Tma family protein [bacterium]|nr:ATP-dependent metallopeptidase FtsH/Yme1/Tma family protein [bacterium]
MPRAMRTMSFWVLMLILLFVGAQLLESGKPREFQVNYSRFMTELEQNNLSLVTFENTELHGKFRHPVQITYGDKAVDVEHFTTSLPFELPDLLETIRAYSTETHPIQIQIDKPRFNWGNMLIYWAPILLLVFLWFFFIRQMQGGSNRAFSFGKSRAKLVSGDKPATSFDDVAGADEAKVELNEIVEFLSDPKKFKRMGARIPRGALLVGPPGTGKTLLAKAVAGEARVPFFSMSGSDFVEMFVGVGASRVRDLFEQGKKSAPCILFVDELDAVGRHRGAGLGGGHDEREQTLNQLLVEMDGFDTSDGVILLAATNRPDVLDPALLRPGRFDRQIIVDMPDVRGREGILKVHMRNLPVADDVNVKTLAQGTPGLSGADLANICNEAALLAARLNHDKVYSIDFEEARDKSMLGPERRSRVFSDETRLKTAYHEAGHAIVGTLLENADTLHKVTIVARGMAGGVTHFLPDEEKYIYRDREALLDTITMALAGMVAEQLIYSNTSSGAASDIKKVTSIARHMVTQWGMSDKLGPIAYGDNEETVFLGRSITQNSNCSEATAQIIDSEVRDIVERCRERAQEVLEQNRDGLDRVANALMERETISGEEVDLLLKGEELAPFDKEAAESARQLRISKTKPTHERIDDVLSEAGKLELSQDEMDPAAPAEPSEESAPLQDDADSDDSPEKPEN